MARLAERADIVGIPQVRTGGPYATFDASPIGEGISRIGQGIASLGGSLSALADRRESASGGLADLNAEKAFLEFEYAETKAYNDFFNTLTPEDLPGAAERYVSGYKERADAFAKTRLDSLEPDARARYDQRLFRGEIQNYQSALKFEQEQAFNFAATQFNQTVDETLFPQYLAMAEDPTLGDKLAAGDDPFATLDAELWGLLEKLPGMNDLQRWAEFERLQADLHKGAAVKLPLREQERLDEVSEAPREVSMFPGPDGMNFGAIIEAEGTARRGNPYDEVLGYGAYGYPSKPVSQLTIAEAIAAGEAIRRHPNNPHNSSAIGAFQIIATNLRRAVREWGFDPNRTFDADTQKAIAARIYREQGYGAWEGFKHNASARAKIGAKDYSFRQGSGSGGGEFNTVSRSLPGLTTEDRIRIATSARSAQAGRANQYKSDLNDMLAFVADGGDPSMIPSIGDIAAVIGPDAAGEFNQELERAKVQGAVANEVQFATPERLAELAAFAAAQRLDPVNYKDDVAFANKVEKQIADRESALANDPARYVLNDQDIAERFTEWQSADSLNEAARAARGYADASLAMQARLGVARSDMRLLTGEALANLAKQFTTQEEGAQPVMQTIRAMQEVWGEHWPQVLKELKDDLPPVIAVAASMDLPEQSVAAEMLVESLAIPKEELEFGFEGAEMGDLREAVESTMESENFLSSTAKQAGSINVDTAEAVRRLALMYVQRKQMTPDKAVAEAYDKIVGIKYEMVSLFGQDFHVRVPRTIEPKRQIFATGTARPYGYWIDYNAGQIKQSLGNYDLDIPIDPAFDLKDEDVRAQYIDSLQGNGTWVTAPDEDGLALVDGDGYHVTVDGGEILVVPWETLNGDMSEHGAAPVDSMMGEPSDTVPEVTVSADDKVAEFVQKMRTMGLSGQELLDTVNNYRRSIGLEPVESVP